MSVSTPVPMFAYSKTKLPVHFLAARTMQAYGSNLCSVCVASSFTSSPPQEFNSSIPWQPVPVHTVPQEKDNVIVLAIDR